MIPNTKEGIGAKTKVKMKPITDNTGESEEDNASIHKHIVKNTTVSVEEIPRTKNNKEHTYAVFFNTGRC